MLEKIKDIIKRNDLCVLATISGGDAHCSLMSYVTDDECHEIYMISHKKTKKYANLILHPSVSLLIDTREEDRENRRSNVKALTVTGEFQNIVDPSQKDHLHSKFLQKHPHLTDFVNDPDAEIFSVKIKLIQLLDGVKDAYFEVVK